MSDEAFPTAPSTRQALGATPALVAGEKARRPNNNQPTRRTRLTNNNNTDNKEQLVNNNKFNEACEGYPGSWEELSDPQRAALARRLVVEPSHRLVYCPAPHHASSSWLKVLLFLASANTSRSYLNPASVPAVAASNRSNHLYLSDLPAAQRASVLRTHRSFVVVRHPLTRLALVYLRKFKQFNPSFAAAYGKYIVEHYRDGAGGVQSSDGTDVQFREFVRYLTDVEDQESMNEHWQPLGLLCRPCVVHYDRLVHFEGLEADGMAMLTSFGLGGLVQMVPGADRWEQVAGEEVKALFSSLPPALLARLVQRYKADVQLLGYTSRV